jgi:threonine/homoserine/homoserine lactone efflux protein
MSFELWLALVALFGIGGLTPGPAVMLVMASSFRYGFKPAMLPALGIASANVLWLLLAASGAAALATTYPKAFMGLKIVGVLVILYLALSAMFGPLPDPDAKAADAPPRAKLFSRGLALQLSSPMPLVYFGLLLPNYFDPTSSMPQQILIMFATVTTTELLGLGAYAFGAQKIRIWLKNQRQARIFNIFIGIVMIGSGIWAILSTSGH